MALDEIKKLYTARDNDFYRNHYHHIMKALIGMLGLMIVVLLVVFYQIVNRPLPQFNAVSPDGKSMLLIPYDEPNLLPDTILRWASKAATLAYTFNYVGYNEQLKAVRPYFTQDGWQDYLKSVNPLINTVVQNKLFINGIVSGAPVISNQGPIPSKGYVWRAQIPFLVTYQSANTTDKRKFYVVVSIIRVPTSENRQAIGIDQFIMVPR